MDLDDDSDDVNKLLDAHFNMSLLHKACQNDEIDTIKTLLRDGADVNIKDSKGCSPLHLTLLGGGCNEAAVLLLESGKCDVNLQDNNGQSPLHWAVGRGGVFFVQLFIKYNANVTLKDNENKTPLDIAFIEDDLEMAELLLKNGGFSPDLLYRAIMSDSEGKPDSDKIDLVLPYIYDVDSFRTKDGKTALHLATELLTSDIPEILLEAGADIEAKTCLKDTPLLLALKKPYIDDMTELLEQLVDWMPSLTVQNAAGQTPLSLMDPDECDVTMMEYICKLTAADILKDRDLKQTNGKQFDLDKTFYKICLSEVEKLKDAKLEDISLYTALTKSREALVHLLRNKSLQEKLTNDFFKHLYCNYPLYGKCLENKLKMALKRSKLTNACYPFFSFTIFSSLPKHCIDYIFYYLSIKELTALSEACY